VASARAQAIRDRTAAACVAWEGNGAARAALFQWYRLAQNPGCDRCRRQEASQRFDASLPIAMSNLVNLLRSWLENTE